MSRQEGMALVLVLWIMSLLTIMAGSYALTIRREISLVSVTLDNAKLKALAEAGLNVAAAMLFYQDAKSTWRGDGSIYSFQFKEAEIRLRIFSESGKIDINKADENVLRAIIKTTPAEEHQQQEIVDAILDWRDKDEWVRIHGAEAQQYRDAGLSYRPLNNDFQTLEELQLVLGMDDDIYTPLAAAMTVYAKQKTVNMAMASRQVLMAVSNVDVILLEEFLAQREASHRLQEQAPEFPFQSGRQQALSQGVFTVFAETQLADNTQFGVRVIISKNPANTSKKNHPQKCFIIIDWQLMFDEESLFSAEMEPLIVKLNAVIQ